MDKKILVAFISAMFIAGALPVQSAYTGDYAVTDIDDVVVDFIGEGLVSAKGEVPTWVSMGSLVILLVLILVALGMLISVFIGLPILALTKLMAMGGKTRKVGI